MVHESLLWLTRETGCNTIQLDEEQFAMWATRGHQTTQPGTIRPRRNHRSDRSPGGNESPYSPYLRRWLAQHAVRHRDLLLNIDAATRLAHAAATTAR